MLLVILSTLALVGLLLDPSFFGIRSVVAYPDTLSAKFDPVKDSIRQDSLRRVQMEQNIYIYDKLNYSLSTLGLKREKLILQDSIYKIWKIVDNYKRRADSINTGIGTGNRLTDSLRNVIAKLEKKEEKKGQQQKNIVEYSSEQVLGYAKAYESMDPEKAAKQLELMPESEALELLINMQPRPAAKILDKIEPIKAAKLWLVLNSKKKR